MTGTEKKSFKERTTEFFNKIKGPALKDVEEENVEPVPSKPLTAEEKLESRKRFILGVVYVAIILLIVYFFLKYAFAWVLPFIIGLLAAFVLNKPVYYLAEKTHLPRGLWSAILVTVVLLLVFGLIGLLGYRLCVEAISFAQNSNIDVLSVTEKLKIALARFSVWSEAHLSESMRAAIESLPATVIEKITTLLGNSASKIIGGVFSNFAGVMLTVLISIVASCFMTARYKENKEFVLKQFSDKTRAVIVKAKNLFTENILKMLRGYFFIFLITFGELFLGLSVIGVKYSFIIALLIAICDIMPVLGTGTVLIPWGIYQLIFANHLFGLEILILYVIITVIRQVIEPRIIGKQVGLKPIVTLMAMYIGLKTVGAVGMICFPIVMIILVKLQECGLVRIWKD